MEKSRVVLQKIFQHNVWSVTTVLLHYRQLVKCVFTVSAILIDDNCSADVSLFTDAVINEALQQCVPVHNSSSTIACFN